VCGNLLTCISLFIESIFEVPLLNRKKKKKRRKEKKKRKEKKRADSLRLFFPSVRSGAL
jgi:hypothetical protein